VTADLGFADLASISAYSNLRYFLNTDITVRFAHILDMVGLGGQRAFIDNASTTNKFSQEVRLSSHDGGALDWIIGGFFTSERSPSYQSLTAISSTGETTDLSTNSSPEHFREIAGFADLTYHFSSKFELQVGGRYSKNKQTYIVGGGTGILGDGSPAEKQQSRDHSFTWLITPRYKIASNLSAYARIATGYRPGGPNSPLIVNNPVYGPDRTTNYEIGLKGETPDRAFGYSASLFWIDWNKIQVSQIDALTEQDFFVNADNARSRGAEFEIYYHPWAGMTLDGNGAYTDAELRSPLPQTDGAASNAIGNKGDRLPFSAHWSGSLSADQRFPVRDDLALSVGGTVAYTGRRLGGFSPSGVRAVAPAYTTLDLRGSVEAGPFTASLFIRNATDRRGLVSAELTAPADAKGGYLLSIIQPRTLGGSIAVKF
jgi:outer membrane receptor protein involved in Fe transport